MRLTRAEEGSGDDQSVLELEKKRERARTDVQVALGIAPTDLFVTPMSVPGFSQVSVMKSRIIFQAVIESYTDPKLGSPDLPSQLSFRPGSLCLHS